ncbi:hemolysin family protein [Porticoccaceae bacterium]|nr:hemolysin family protein [Porticoccaceae bacterium]
MFLLITYVLIALGFSFLCSIAEAVLLSATNTHIALMEKEQKPAGRLLRRLKDDVNKPLAAILTLNTIAHTVGAAGAGAQAVSVFGSAYVGIASAVLTLLILIFSEIIPKTLGAHYWRQLAPVTAYVLKYLIILLYPFVKLSDWLTGSLHGPTLNGFSREEFSVMADLSSKEGQIAEQESHILKNLLLLRETRVTDAMTPRTVIFSLSKMITVEEFFHKYDHVSFSRIPVYSDEQENISGFVFRSDLLLAKARGNGDNTLSNYRRDITAVPGSMSLSQVFNELLKLRVHMMLVVDEYGGVEGIITLEDVLETLLGLEIVDEKDNAVDMQKEARRQWKRRAGKMGLKIDGEK